MAIEKTMITLIYRLTGHKMDIDEKWNKIIIRWNLRNDK